MEIHSPSLQGILDKKSLKWIFVGGKGGVGKTTCSCSLAVQLAAVRTSVLLVSTDPAHNLSDAFSQKFSGDPSLVNGFTNLYAMEVDPKSRSSDAEFGAVIEQISDFPGLSEAMSIFEIFNRVLTFEYEVIVFDTAPTGHTLKLIHLPQQIELLLNHLSSMTGAMSLLFNQFGPAMGLAPGIDPVQIITKFKSSIKNIRDQFTNADLTTFVCVCIPEFLSVYETERLIQDLTEHKINTEYLIVNYIIIPEDNCNSKLFKKRALMQQKYLNQIQQLYAENFHIARLPLLETEIRGVSKITTFSKLLIDPTILQTNSHWTLLQSSN
eukprot:c20792_g1_i1.p1 GENE.c20792_g1_i1~~c20792_g1_i1.p1  ORF type:complete len:331 (+),score=116.84 c20792_g1_i1:23-994(+)